LDATVVPGLGKFEDGTNLGLFLKMEQSFCPNISGYIRIVLDMLSDVNDVIIFWWHLFGPSIASNYLHPSQWLVNLLLILR
jgi:hypothetical protein